MQAFELKNLILIVNFSKSGQIRTNSGEIGEEIHRQKMHVLKIVETLEALGFEVCEMGKIRKLSSYYIHHFNAYKKQKKKWVYYTHRRNKGVGILYPRGSSLSGYIIPTPKIKKRV